MGTQQTQLHAAAYLPANDRLAYLQGMAGGFLWKENPFVDLPAAPELLGVTAAEARSQTRAGCGLAEAACALLLDNSRA